MDYLKIVANRENLEFYTVDINYNDDFERSLNERFLNAFESKIVHDLNRNYSCIAILPFTGNERISNFIDNNFKYRREDFDSFTVYFNEEK